MVITKVDWIAHSNLCQPKHQSSQEHNGIWDRRIAWHWTIKCNVKITMSGPFLEPTDALVIIPFLHIDEPRLPLGRFKTIHLVLLEKPQQRHECVGDETLSIDKSGQVKHRRPCSLHFNPQWNSKEAIDSCVQKHPMHYLKINGLQQLVRDIDKINLQNLWGICSKLYA